MTVQNPKDSSISYTLAYDVANQLKTITYSDGVTPNVSVQYDPDGQRTQMGDGTAQQPTRTTRCIDSFRPRTAPGLKLLMAMISKATLRKCSIPGGQTSSPGPTMTLAGLRQ